MSSADLRHSNCYRRVWCLVNNPGWFANRLRVHRDALRYRGRWTTDRCGTQFCAVAPCRRAHRVVCMCGRWFGSFLGYRFDPLGRLPLGVVHFGRWLSLGSRHRLAEFAEDKDGRLEHIDRPRRQFALDKRCVCVVRSLCRLKVFGCRYKRKRESSEGNMYRNRRRSRYIARAADTRDGARCRQQHRLLGQSPRIAECPAYRTVGRPLPHRFASRCNLHRIGHNWSRC